jgi:outer membrane protein TolC
VLRWEQKNTPWPPDAPLHPDAGQLTLARAMRLALQDQTLWIKPGMSAQEMAETRQQAAALRWVVQKLWVDAVATRQSVAYSRDILAVAQAGAELAQRMAQVGNWSRARQIQEELLLWDAHSRLAMAEWQAERALNALWQRIGAGMRVQALAQQLPAHLPLDLPVDASAGLSVDVPVKASVNAPVDAPTVNLDDVVALQAQALQAHLRWPVEDAQARRLMAGLGLSATELQVATQALNDQAGQDVPVWNPRTLRWGHDFEKAWQARAQADRLARQVRADVQVAVATYRLARENAHTSRAEVLRLHTELSQETLLRYNGMLQSTWDLLASVRTRTERVDAALQAQRQAWLARADLMAVLAGLPYAGSTNAADASSLSNTSTNSAGH